MKNREPLILLVEDDREIRTMVAELLEREGWRVAAAEHAEAMDARLARETPVLAVLDINLPGEDGLSICRRLSARGDIAILMLSARGDDIDRIIGLEIGADDYLAKPFNPRELVARCRALMRRTVSPRLQGNDTAENDSVSAAGLTIDRSTREVRDGADRMVELTGAEFELVWLLASANGRVLSRDYLLDAIHGREAGPFDRAIDVLVSRVRKKLDREGAQSRIVGVRNAGYVLRAPGA